MSSSSTLSDLLIRTTFAVLASDLAACGEGAMNSGPSAVTEAEAPVGGAAASPGGSDTAPGSMLPSPARPRPRPAGDFEASEPVLPRLTATQYRNTLVGLFGEGLPRTPVEPDTNPYLFYSIGASTTEVSERGVEQYAEAADLVVTAVFDDAERRAELLPCALGATDETCLEVFIRTVGRRLFRRPLEEDEVEGWVTLANETAEGDLDRGAEGVLTALLQSPQFLYRVELGEPDPAKPGGPHRLTSFEMAGRVAFLLTNAGPDDALLDAASRLELLDEETLIAQTQRLLGSPQARVAVQDFFAQVLDLSRLSQVDLDPERYPGFGPDLVRAMETEVRLLVDELVFRKGGDVRDLFSQPRGYVNDALAALYGVEAPEATATAFVPVDFPVGVPRAGLLTLGAFLTMNAHRTETSPTLRGKYVRERVLCLDVPPPPDDVDLDLTPRENDPPTLRERLEQHRVNPVCAGCHAYIDPPGFLFEHYDSMGRYRDAVDGYPINAKGDLDGQPLNNALDLAKVLSRDERVGTCLTRQLYRYALGRLDVRGDAPALYDLHEAFAAGGFEFRALLTALVVSPAFRTVAAAEIEGSP